MSEPNRYYNTQHVAGEKRILPSPEVVAERCTPVLFMFLVLSLAPIVIWTIIEKRITPTILVSGLWPAPLFLLFAWKNRQLAQQGKVPLVVGQNHSIWYNDRCLFESHSPIQHVSVSKLTNIDDMPVYDVLITEKTGSRAELPYPFFCRLSAVEAAFLAKQLAAALNAPLIQEIVSESQPPKEPRTK